MPEFSLNKWYLDVVSPDGQAAIINLARCRLGPLHLSAVSVLWSKPGAEPQSETRLAGFEEPHPGGDHPAWRCDSLGLGVAWSTPEPACQPQHLLSDQRSPTVTWSILSPRAETRVSWNGSSIRGLGYAERLDLRTPPWKLPIDQLRWGRALAEGSWVVWLEWKGPEPRAVVLSSTSTDAVPRIDDTTVAQFRPDRAESPPSLQVALHEGRVLREGTLASAALRAIPGLNAWGAGAWLNSHERKLICPATITRGGDSDHAWAIHETVRFAHPPVNT